MEKNVSTELASNTTSKGYRNTMPVRRYTGFNFSQTSGVNQFRQTGHIFDHCSMVSRYKVHKKLIYLILFFVNKHTKVNYLNNTECLLP